MTKTDNHNPQAKLDLRRYFLEKYHANEPPDVFDCCQGSGLLWSALRKEFTVRSYWGVDLKPKSGRLKIDSVRILQQGIPHDVIDVDTYGAPWKHWQAIRDTCTKPTTVFLTIGSTMFRGSVDSVAAESMGVSRLKSLPISFYRILSPIAVSYALTACCEKSTITEMIEATSDGNARYIGVRVEPKQNEPEDAVTSPAQHTTPV